MASRMTEEEIYEEARKRVRAKKDLYVHIAVYICYGKSTPVSQTCTEFGMPQQTL